MKRLGPTLACLLAALLFGLSTPASRVLVEDVGPLRLAGLLYLGAALAMLPIVGRGGRRERTARRWDAKNLWRLGAMVLAGGVVGPVLLLLGLARAPAASVALWLTLETVATALIAAVFFREHVSRRTWISVALITAASVLLASPAGFSFGLGAALVALACIAWGADNALASVIDGFTPAESTFAKGLVAGSVNLGIGLWLDSGPLSATHVLAGVAIGALSYGVSLVLYVGAAQQLGATRSQMLFSTAPIGALVVSWTWLGEDVLGAQLAAGALMAGALYLAHTQRHVHAHRHEATTHVHGHRHDDEHHTHTHPGLPASTFHVHQHTHEEILEHSHSHEPDLHHRHTHES